MKLMLLTPAPNRGAGELVAAVRQVSEKMRLSLNGAWFPDNIEKDPARFENLQRTPDADGYRQAIARHDIGVLCYRPSNLNDVVISRSSGQLADYLRLGIPVVAFVAPEMGRFVTEAGVGAAAHDAASLDLACRTIRANYADMSRRARALFEQHYDFQLYAERLKEFVCRPDTDLGTSP
jgi:glycosyltransferase involved in cell wall biosynthesis